MSKFGQQPKLDIDSWRGREVPDAEAGAGVIGQRAAAFPKLYAEQCAQLVL